MLAICSILHVGCVLFSSVLKELEERGEKMKASQGEENVRAFLFPFSFYFSLFGCFQKHSLEFLHLN